MGTPAITCRRFASAKLLGLVIAIMCGVVAINIPTRVVASDTDSESCDLSVDLPSSSLPGDFTPLAPASFPILQPLNATTTYTTVDYPAYSGLVMSSSTTVYGGHTSIGIGTPLTPTNPPAGSSTTSSGNLTFSSNMTLSGGGILALNTTASQSSLTIIPLETEPLITGITISMYANHNDFTLVGGTFAYTDLSKILATNGTFILVGTNSGGQADGTVPEPVATSTIFLASLAFSLRRNRSLRRS